MEEDILAPDATSSPEILMRDEQGMKRAGLRPTQTFLLARAIHRKQETERKASADET